jgi:glc operon protein GlcG
MNVAVVDSGGNLVAFQRMDGAMLASIQIAEHKARAAATFRRPTKEFEVGINVMHLNYLLAFDGIIASRGGIPLIEQGRDYRRNRLFGRRGFAGRDRQQRRRGIN